MDWLIKYFQIITEKQTYLNIIYLALAFPLGLAYFIFLVTGLSVGLGLLIVWVGIFILLLVYAIWYGLLALERILANFLLNAQIPPMIKEDLSGKTIWQKFSTTLASPVTWKGLLFLFLKFPIGLISFIVLVTFGSISMAMISAPIFYNFVPAQIDLNWNSHPINSIWIIDTLPEAMGFCLLGIAITPLFLHVFNWITKVSGKFAHLMLGDFSASIINSQVINSSLDKSATE